MEPARTAPPAARLHHVTLTVADLGRSVDWYSRVLGAARTMERSGDGWRRVVLRTPDGLQVGITVFDTTPPGQVFDPARIGMDHVGIHVADRAGIEAWAAHLDGLGIAHSRTDAPHATLLVTYDPDGIPVEWFAPA
jgi:catechol 2,3-dioxygenase-like lactoylglutathione lyase family enzyme